MMGRKKEIHPSPAAAEANGPEKQGQHTGMQTEGVLAVTAGDDRKLEMAAIQPGTTQVLLSDAQIPNSVTSQRTNLQKLEDTEKNNYSFMHSMKSIAARGMSVQQSTESDKKKKKRKHQKTVNIDFDQFHKRLNRMHHEVAINN